MKDKTITLTPRGISQKQWSSFLLELNLMKKAWRPYGVNLEIKASGLRSVLKWGTTVHEDKKTRRTRKSLQQNQAAEV